MPQKAMGSKLKTLGERKSLAFLGFVLLVGVAGALLLPLAWQGFSGAVFLVGFLLAATLLLAYAVVVCLPALLTVVEPTPFPLHNGTDKKVKKFRVKANCKDGSSKVVIDADFTVEPYGPPMYLPPGDTAPLNVESDACDPTSLTVTVTLEDGQGNEITVTTDEIPVEPGGAGECNVILTEDTSTLATTIYVHVFCNGKPPVDIRVPCH